MSLLSQESPIHSRRSGSTISEDQQMYSLQRLHSITAKLLQEDTEMRTNHSPTAHNLHNSHRCKPESPLRHSDPYNLKPWVESTIVDQSNPWTEASPVEILSIQESKPHKLQPRDSVTENTALCSAFEMISLEYFCNGGNSKPVTPTRAIAAAATTPPIKILGEDSPAQDDLFRVPREITFSNEGLCGCSNIPMNDAKKSSRKNLLPNPNKLIKKLRPLLNCRAEKNHVMKVKVLIDNPMECNGSIGNSTVTMPKELQRSSTNSTI